MPLATPKMAFLRYATVVYTVLAVGRYWFFILKGRHCKSAVDEGLRVLAA